MKKLFILFLILIVVSISGCIDSEDQIACPADAKLCPDGSSVSRIAPDCEFAECPEVIEPEPNETIEESIVYVEILDMEYYPDEITISPGTTVVWTNLDDIAHTVSSSRLKKTSGRLDTGESWNYTFEDTTVLNYYDSFYFFKGTVIVE